MASSSAITALASAARTTNGDSGAGVDIGTKTAVELNLDVTGVSGTSPTLDVTIEHSRDGAVWSTLATFARVAAVGTSKLVAAGTQKFVRATWTIGGTSPSFTFAISGLAIVCYASPSDLARVGVKSDVTSTIPASDLASILIARTTFADGYLRGSGRYVFPITGWGEDLRLAVAQLAAWDALTALVGINPDDPGDGAVWVARRDEAMRWLERVASGAVVPGEIVDSSPTVVENGMAVYTEPLRGW